MSEPLTGDAPVVDDAVSGFEAPEVPAAVEASSGSGDGKTIPVERFNGLMSTFNKAQAELERVKRERLDLEDRLREFEARINDTDDDREDPVANDEVARLNEQVQMLTNMLVSKEVQGAKESLVKEFPDIAPFADLIDGNDPAAMRALAEQLNERVQVFKAVNGEPPATPSSEEAPPAAPEAQEQPPTQEPPVFGGGSGQVPPGGSDIQDRINEAIKNRDLGAFMQAKTEQALQPELTL